MRNACVFYLLLLNLTSLSQNYIPLVVDQANWRIEYVDVVNFEVLEEFSYTILGDTLVNNTLYKKVFKNAPTNNEVVAVIREDTLERRVYAIQFENESDNDGFCPLSSDFLLYDFSGSIRRHT